MSIINELIDNYLSKPIMKIENVEKLDQLIDYELNAMNEKRKSAEESEEIKSIRYLLDHRNKTNNTALNELLRYKTIK